MKVLSKPALIVVLSLSALSVACSSSSGTTGTDLDETPEASEPGLVDDEPSNADQSPPEAPTSDVPEQSDDPTVPAAVPVDVPADTPADVPADIPADVPADAPADIPADVPADAPADIPADVPADAPADIPADVPADAPADIPADVPADVPADIPADVPADAPTDIPADVPADDQETPPQEEEAEPDPVVDEASPDLGMLIPAVSEGGDLARLIRGVTQQVSLTLLGLNSTLADGTELTEQQDVCLGAFDPALGEQLLAIDCERALATGDVAIFVESASFYDTAACNTNIFNGNTDSCVLQSARMTIPTSFVIPETPEGSPERPQPIAGMEIHYAVGNTDLRIENTEGALTGAFRCDLDLADEQATTVITGQSCSDIIMNTANRLDELLPE